MTLAVLIMSAGCSATNGLPQDGPVDIGGGTNTSCYPVPVSAFTWGFDAITNSGQKSAFVQRVAIENPQNVEIVDAYVVDVFNQTLIGVLAGWPPSGVRPELSAIFSGPGQLPQEVPPSPNTNAGDKNLVLHLKVDRAGGKAAGFSRVRVDYQYDGKEYSAYNGTALQLKDDC